MYNVISGRHHEEIPEAITGRISHEISGAIHVGIHGGPAETLKRI